MKRNIAGEAPQDTAPRVSAGAISIPAAAKTKQPRPGTKTGGRGWSGGARSGRPVGRLEQAPLPWLPAARPANGATAAEWPRRSQPPPLQKNGMAGACRRGRPPPLPRETAQQGHRGAQRNPAAGAQAFAPSGRRQLRKRGRRERLRRKADDGHGPLHQRDGAARIPKSAEQAQRRRHTSAHGGPAAATAARSPTDGASIPLHRSFRRELPSRGGNGGPIYRATIPLLFRRRSR